jgi:hypothetical protein
MSLQNTLDYCPAPIADAIKEFFELSGLLARTASTTDSYKLLRQKLGHHWADYVYGIQLSVLRDELLQCRALDFSEHSQSFIENSNLYPEMMRLHRLVQNAISERLAPYIQEERIKAAENGLEASNDELRCLAMRQTDWGEAATELHNVLLAFCDLLIEMEYTSARNRRRIRERSGKLQEKLGTEPYRKQLERWFENGRDFVQEVLNVPDLFDFAQAPKTRFCEAFEIIDENSVSWCNSLTESEDYLQGNIPDSQRPAELRRLSNRYCRNHRMRAGNLDWDRLPSIKKLYVSDLPVEVQDEEACKIYQAFLSKVFTERTQQQSIALLDGRKFCLVCARRTERQAWNLERPFIAGMNRQSQPSSEFCRYHRTIGHDGSWDKSQQRDNGQSTYQSRINKIPIFAAEFKRLLGMSPSRDARHPSDDSVFIKYFIEHVMSELDCYPDEDQDMRRIAWEIVEHRISDRKKKIVSLAACGWSYASIAENLGITPQAVQKNLKSVPPAYRFDLKSSPSNAESSC